MICWHLSHCLAKKALASLRNCADLQEPSLLALTNYGCRCKTGRMEHSAPTKFDNVNTLFN